MGLSPAGAAGNRGCARGPRDLATLSLVPRPLVAKGFVFRSLFQSQLTGLQTAWFTEANPLSCVTQDALAGLSSFAFTDPGKWVKGGWDYE